MRCVRAREKEGCERGKWALDGAIGGWREINGRYPLVMVLMDRTNVLYCLSGLALRRRHGLYWVYGCRYIAIRRVLPIGRIRGSG